MTDPARPPARAAPAAGAADAAPSPVLHAVIREFRYPGSAAPALSGIELAIAPGEFVLITGPAGAGKTTLCFALTGVIPKSVSGRFDGEVRAAGANLADRPLPRVGPLLGLVMQIPENQLFNLTVAEDVAFGPENLQLPEAEVRARVRRGLEFTGTAHLAQRFSHTLSGGQAQRVVLSSVLAMDPGVYIFDQPAAELDPAGRRRIYENIARLNREAGKTIVLVEDRLADVIAYATRVVLMDGGRIVRDAPPAEFFADREPQARGVRLPAAVELYHALHDVGVTLPAVPLTGDHLVAAVRAAVPPGTAAARASVPPGTAAPPAPAAPPQAEAPPAPAGEPVIEVQDLHYRYPTGVEALAGVSLRVGAGEFVALVGENGAGKTTLAKHLIGLLRPASGAVRVMGADLRRQPVHEIARRVGFLFQDPDLQTFNNSCLEEVAYGLKLRRLPAAEVQARARAALEEVGLAEHAEAHPYTLSRGQRQRLAVAAVLALRPPVLVVDEPSTGLDYRETLAMMSLLEGYRRAGGTLLIITHDMEIAAGFAHRIVVIAHGRLLHDVPAAEAAAHFGGLQEAALFLPELAGIARQLGLPPGVRDARAAALALAGGAGKEVA
jgi:energy-coupling factor transport system ATP-binding protein